jgi:hypothetical protein
MFRPSLNMPRPTTPPAPLHVFWGAKYQYTIQTPDQFELPPEADKLKMMDIRAAIAFAAHTRIDFYQVGMAAVTTDRSIIE